MKFVFFNVPTSGHVNPSLPLAAELVRRGHGIVYYLTEGYRDKVEATGAEFRAYSGMGEDYFDEVSRRFNPVLLATQLVETTEALLPGLVDSLREEGADAVIYDAMCPWGRLAAGVAGLPAIASMSLLDLPLSLLLKSGGLLTAAGLMARSIPGLGRYRRAAKRVSKLTQRPVAGFPEIINWAGELTINYSSERFLKGGAPDSSFVFIGPPVQERPDDVPLLMVPQQLEQALVAARVSEMGAGLVVRPQKVTVDGLRGLAGRLLDEPGFRVGAAEIGAALRAAGGVERGVEAIEGFMNGR